MPKRKNSQPTPAARPRRRPKGPDKPDASTPAHSRGQTSAEPPDCGSAPILSNEQLQQVSEAVAEIMARQNHHAPIEPVQPSVPMEPFENHSAGTEPELLNRNYLHTSYDNDLGHMVPNKLKFKIVNGEYINLGLLVENSNGVDPNDNAKYFTLKEGCLSLAPKTKSKVIADIQTWTDAFLIYASIYTSAHPESRVELLNIFTPLG